MVLIAKLRQFTRRINTPKRRVAAVLVSASALAGLAIVCSAALVNHAASGKTYSDVDAIPHRRVGVVLGCTPKLSRAVANPFYENRIAAAVALFHAGKVDYLIVSGDNHNQGYDEPSEMKASLIHAGIPAAKIYPDYAGFRTMDSIVRAKEVFGQSEITVVSQEFHNQRAIFIAQHSGVDAIGFNAADIGLYYSFNTKSRELLAKVKTVLDIYILNTKPKFLGPKVVIG